MSKIIVVGSSNTDMVVKTARFPEPGETILGGDFFMFPGGKGANQAVAALAFKRKCRLCMLRWRRYFWKKSIGGLSEGRPGYKWSKTSKRRSNWCCSYYRLTDKEKMK